MQTVWAGFGGLGQRPHYSLPSKPIGSPGPSEAGDAGDAGDAAAQLTPTTNQPPGLGPEAGKKPGSVSPCQHRKETPYNKNPRIAIDLQ